VSGSAISWAICKSAPRSRQITTPTPHQQFFTGRMPFLSPNQQRQSTERGTERQQKVQFLPPERHLTSTKHCVCVCACVSKSTVQMTWQELFLKEHQFSYVSQHGQPTRVLHLRISHVTIPSADTDSSGHRMPLYPFSAMMLLFATGRTAGL